MGFVVVALELARVRLQPFSGGSSGGVVMAAEAEVAVVALVAGARVPVHGVGREG